MRCWSFEVQHGRITTLPQSLKMHADQQRLEGAGSFFVFEGGTLLNEPDEQTVARILSFAEPSIVIAKMSEAVGWVFDRFDTELESDFKFNYLKVSFVNLNPVRTIEDQSIGRMSFQRVCL